jgi:hypothetical protein
MQSSVPLTFDIRSHRWVALVIRPIVALSLIVLELRLFTDYRFRPWDFHMLVFTLVLLGSSFFLFTYFTDVNKDLRGHDVSSVLQQEPGVAYRICVLTTMVLSVLSL